MSAPALKRGGAQTAACRDRDYQITLWHLRGDWPAELDSAGRDLLWTMAHQDASSSLEDLLTAVHAVLAPPE